LLGLLQATSHLHESAQSMLRHADGPLQLMPHGFMPQSIAVHEDCPEQSISQLAPWLQSMSPQAPMSLQVIVQSKPAGHWTAPHGWAPLQSTRHVRALRSHAVHGLGQEADTQYPLSQIRLSSQSPSVLHAKPSDRRFTRQLVADSHAIPNIARIRRMPETFLTDLTDLRGS
jgi:hypothetical protein